MNKKGLIVAVLVVLIAVLGFVGYQRISDRRATAEAPTETALVRRGTLLLTLDATGSLGPHAEVVASFTSGGQVAEVLVEEGQQVEAGQPLARLDTDDLALQVAQAEANLAQVQAGARAEDIAAAEAAWRSAQANYEKVAAGSRAEDVAAAEAALRNAQANYEALLADPSEDEITVAAANLRTAEVALQSAQWAYDEVAYADAVGASPQAAELQRATIAYESALASYRLAVQGPTDEQLKAAQAQVDQARAQLEKLKNSPTAEELAAAQAQVDQAQAQLDKLVNGPTAEELAIAQVQVDQARLRLEQATLTAPMAGTVTALNVQPGEMAGTGQPAVVLSDLAALEAEVNLDETDVARIATGMTALVAVDAFPGVELSGRVIEIAPTADIQSGVVLYPVAVRLDPTDLPLRSGMTVNVTFPIEQRTATLIVPFRAVETEGGQAYVTRVTASGREAERATVTLGLITDTQVEILSGLEERDVVTVYANPVQDTRLMSNPMFGGGQ